MRRPALWRHSAHSSSAVSRPRSVWAPRGASPFSSAPSAASRSIAATRAPLATMVAAVLLGPGIVAGVGMPSSPVHFLLAALAVLTVPALRLLAIRRSSTHLGWWMAAGAALTLLALLGLWSTGS